MKGILESHLDTGLNRTILGCRKSPADVCCIIREGLVGWAWSAVQVVQRMTGVTGAQPPPHPSRTVLSRGGEDVREHRHKHLSESGWVQPGVAVRKCGTSCLSSCRSEGATFGFAALRGSSQSQFCSSFRLSWEVFDQWASHDLRTALKIISLRQGGSVCCPPPLCCGIKVGRYGVMISEPQASEMLRTNSSEG